MLVELQLIQKCMNTIAKYGSYLVWLWNSATTYYKLNIIESYKKESPNDANNAWLLLWNCCFAFFRVNPWRMSTIWQLWCQMEHQFKITWLQSRIAIAVRSITARITWTHRCKRIISSFVTTFGHCITFYYLLTNLFSQCIIYCQNKHSYTVFIVPVQM